jgi:hypothetical protein
MTRWNSERWQQTGTSGAGDPVYSRGIGGGTATYADDLSGLTKAELQEIAAERGLPTSGTKADLIERLNG